MRDAPDDTTGPHGGSARRPRPAILWGAGAVAVLIAVAAGLGIGAMAEEPDEKRDKPGSAKPTPAAGVAADDVHDVTIDPGIDDVDLKIGGDDVDVIVHNGFGRDIPGVTMELTIEEPEDGAYAKIGVHGGDEFCEDAARSKGVSKADGEADCERLQKSGTEWCRPKADYDEPAGQHSKCFRTLHPGENRYLYDMSLSVAEPTEAQVYNYPDLMMSVVLSIDGTEFARDETEIPGEAVR